MANWFPGELVQQMTEQYRQLHAVHAVHGVPATLLLAGARDACEGVLDDGGRGPVTVLGIDETRRGRPSWVQDELTGRWRLTERFETNFVDLTGPQGLLGQTSGRTKVAVAAWLDERGQAWKDTVQIVAMDPCASYRAAVHQALPQARIVADHFHLVRLANQASPTSAAGSPGTPTADVAARPTRPGPPDEGSCAAESGCPRRSSSGCGTT